MILAGIDEAGLGPVLGPLVASAAAFRVAPQAAEEARADLWTLLSSCVARDLRHARKAGRVAIGDSKKLYSRQAKQGLSPLERGVLAMLLAAEGQAGAQLPKSLTDLLHAVAPGAAERAKAYPWYDRCDLAIPRSVDATDLELTSNALKVGLREAGVGFLGLRSEPVFVGEFNRMIEATQNKSTTAFDVTCRLLAHLWSSAPEPLLHVTVDRQGGRMRYCQPLLRVFAGCELKVLGEDEQISAYRITQGPRCMEVRFEVGAERRNLPVALASMACKYLRELFMEMFNAFWARHVENLAPTAGYYVDGRRFYREIQPAMARLGVDERTVYRSR
jgi:hypothetical protein